MAFPTVETVLTQSFTAATTHNVDMPATVNAGDLLIVGITFETNQIATTPSGWTAEYEATGGLAGAGNCSGSAYVKVADGTEGGTSVNFETGQPRTGAAVVYRISAWDGALTGVESATPVDNGASGSTNPDPPSLTASWGAEDNLWLAFAHTGEDGESVDSGPSGYTGFNATRSGSGADDVAIGTARLEDAAATEDPGTFTLSGDEAWVAGTLVIRPASDTTDPTLSSTTPTDNATDVAVTANPTATFSEDIAFGTGNITLRDVAGASNVEVFDVTTDTGGGAGTVSISGDTLTIEPTSDLSASTEYAIQIDSTAIDDLAGNSYAGISDDTTWSFTTAAAGSNWTMAWRRRR